MSLEIVNIIASAKIEGTIDVETLFQKLHNTSYNPEIFPGLVYRKFNRKPTIIMFASGKISSHGSRSEKIAIESINETLKEIDKLGCVVGGSEIRWIRIENVVGTANLFREIDLEQLYGNLTSAVYEPEQFPGLIYRQLEGSLTCLVFSTGKMVIVGGKSENQISEAFEVMKKLIYGPKKSPKNY